MALQEAAEAYLVSLFEDTNLAGEIVILLSKVPLAKLLLYSHPRQARHYPTQGPRSRQASSRRAFLMFGLPS